ncbi:MAG: ankyrin repeat domain-containing protein [Ideonella sp.]|nr:ankyrin repeat domain-containing protein [Ideonella sp.]MCC7457981.1 ankyrin repeat domain-containing protein [Nitrospira sp.]
MKYLKYCIYLIITTAFCDVGAGSFDDFFLAVKRDDASSVAALLERGFDVNAVDEAGQPALVLAANQGSSQVVEQLLRSRQIQPDAPNHSGETALMLAALRGHMGIVERLLALGAAVNRAGWSPLHYAATGPDPQIVELLIAKGAQVDARSPNGTTPLMMAARYGNEESITLLLAAKADRALRNQRQMNAADFARSAERESLAKRLDSRLH